MATKVECGECGKPVKEKLHDQHMERVHGRRIQVYASGYAGDGIRTEHDIKLLTINRKDV